MTDFETNRALLRRVRVACLLAALAGVSGGTHAQCGDWEPVGTGVTNDDVRALAVFDDGSGPALYAGGYFYQIGGSHTGPIARWDGTAWSPLGGYLDTNGILSLTVFGSELYAAGFIWSHPSRGIARWDGTAWRPVGTGLGWGSPMGRTMTVVGSSLYVGGNFEEYFYHAPGNNIARWNGSSWSAMGSGLAYNSSFEEAEVFVLAGWGNSVFAGGRFTHAGGSPANRIARWSGAAWWPVGTGVSGGGVSSLAVFNDGSGSALYAGGGFTEAGGNPANRVARWDGWAWSALGEGVSEGTILALTVFDDGTGPALYAAGWFTEAGGIRANNIARWDGTAWTPLGAGVSGGQWAPIVFALEVFDDGTGPALYAAGQFAQAGGSPASNIARWVPRPPCRADLNGDCVVDIDDFFLYLDLFADGDPIADINGDGVLDADDFFEYLVLFAAGC